MLFILDEWIFHDLQNDNGEDKQRESVLFLEKVKEKCDKIVFISESNFSNKFYSLSKYASKGPEFKTKLKLFKNSFYFNSQKSIQISLNEIKQNDYNLDLSNINVDDQYLPLCFYKLKELNEDLIIITADEKLKDLLSSKDISIKMRDDFLNKYLDS